MLRVACVPLLLEQRRLRLTACLNLQVAPSALTSSEQLLELDQGSWEGLERRECYSSGQSAAPRPLLPLCATSPWPPLDRPHRNCRCTATSLPTLPTSRTELTARFAADPWRTAWHFTPPDGESQRQVEERMAAYIVGEVRRSCTAQRVRACVHAG